MGGISFGEFLRTLFRTSIFEMEFKLNHGCSFYISSINYLNSHIHTACNHIISAHLMCILFLYFKRYKTHPRIRKKDGESQCNGYS